MHFRFTVLAFAFLAAAVPVARSDEKASVDGNWIFSLVNPTGDQALCLTKIETKEGTTTITVIEGQGQGITPKVSDLKTANGLTFKIAFGPNALSFEAGPGNDGKTILGSIGNENFSQRAKLTATKSDKLEPQLNRNPAATLMSKALSLNFRPNNLRNQARQAKDPEKKKELLEQVAEAQKEADEAVPKMYRDIVKNHSDSPAAYDAAVSLIGISEKAKVDAKEATALTKLVLEQSGRYGLRFAKPAALRLADSLVRQKGLEAVALIAVEPAAKALTDKDPLSLQFDVLSSYKTALAGANKTAEAKAVEGRLTKIDSALDKEYHEKVPPFKPVVFKDRKGSSSGRVAVMELFTGAQCPPCVAADVAFDALEKTYQPSELILIQYHMHIPGPDPLTNADTVARWDYYGSLRGTPSTLFNGKQLAGGGGGMANAHGKYDEFRKAIDPLLEKTTALKLSGKAVRHADKIEIAVDVSGIEDPEDLKLRLLIVEDTIKYVGGNKLRFHHHVVRAMPGGAGGVAIKENAMKHSTSADIASIRQELVKYLDDFAKERPFPHAARPLDLKDLKVIALVQNDKTKEILQAVQVEVK